VADMKPEAAAWEEQQEAALLLAHNHSFVGTQSLFWCLERLAWLLMRGAMKSRNAKIWPRLKRTRPFHGHRGR